ncbi:MAG: hypothetical protein LC772_12030 [Chloroflexi bacterium]|nr:hypothetical protein [Chloroflexota bacterium]
MWNARTGRSRAIYTEHGGDVTSASFSPNGRQVLTGSKAGSANVWDVRTLKTIASIGVEDAVGIALISPDGDEIVTAPEYAGQAVLWQSQSGKPIATLE